MTIDTQNSERRPSKSKGHGDGFRLRLPTWMRRTASHRELEAEIERQIRAHDGDIPDEMLKQLVQDIAADIQTNEARNSIRSSFLRLLLLPVILLVAVLLFAVLLDARAWEPKVEKAPIQQDVLAALHNGADVETLKVIFKTRAISVDSLAFLIRGHDFYSKTNTTLLDVLNDLKTNILIQKNPITDQNKTLVARIDEILLEYGKVNPFDGLEENQRRDLMNVAKKLSSENYSSISDDVSSLVVELKQKNSLVTKYLNSSEISLWISIVALALTIVLGFWQFRPKARKTQKELIQEALTELNVKYTNDKG